ncbi:MAG: hypothetical protein WCA85_13805, partial [Paraburkholderia sp.]|uniref:hypothetical protein n=1 Tax=Paraburkholderia sp. TaxID=1926495 RepID=UPI003C60A00C
MKARTLNQYYYGMSRGIAVLIAGAGLLTGHAVHAATTADVVSPLALSADAPLPASGARAGSQLM